MEDILSMFRDYTGYDYEGNTQVLDLEPENNDGESDIDISLEPFGSDSSDSEDETSLDLVDLNNDSGDWSATTTDVVVENFTEICGPTHDLPYDATPFDYFSLLIPENFYEHIAVQTNLYANYRQQKEGKVDRAWQPTTASEIKLLFHIYITMGIHVLPEYKMYWASDERLRVDGVAGSMGKTRFEKLSQYFHLNDATTFVPRGHPGHDPLHKVRPFLDLIRTNIATRFAAGKNISLDEAMIPFNGRLMWKQYIKGKPNPWGIKVWCATDASTGYLLNFSIYTGKVEDPMPHGTGHYIVTQLGERFLGKRHHFFFDNYFSSVQLAEDLLRQQTYCCSTIRPNRKGWPLDLKPKALKKFKKGDVMVRQKGNLVATAWKDKRCVTLLSTNTTSGTAEITRRGPGGNFQVKVPSAVNTYNKSMGGVDRFDQLSSYYPVGRKSVKWWRYIFRFLLQTAVINSWIIYATSHRPRPKSLSLGHLEFRLEISTALLKGNIVRKRKQSDLQPSTQGVGMSDLLEHRLIRMVGNKRACHWCMKNKQFGKRNRAHETVYGCNLCQIRLCKGECFSKFHNSLTLPSHV